VPFFPWLVDMGILVEPSADVWPAGQDDKGGFHVQSFPVTSVCLGFEALTDFSRIAGLNTAVICGVSPSRLAWRARNRYGGTALGTTLKILSANAIEPVAYDRSPGKPVSHLPRAVKARGVEWNY
jgi:hypothetical protein